MGSTPILPTQFLKSVSSSLGAPFGAPFKMCGPFLRAKTAKIHYTIPRHFLSRENCEKNNQKYFPKFVQHSSLFSCLPFAIINIQGKGSEVGWSAELRAYRSPEKLQKKLKKVLTDRTQHDIMNISNERRTQND